jgi:hypothetical protein
MTQTQLQPHYRMLFSTHHIFPLRVCIVCCVHPAPRGPWVAGAPAVAKSRVPDVYWSVYDAQPHPFARQPQCLCCCHLQQFAMHALRLRHRCYTATMR